MRVGVEGRLSITKPITGIERYKREIISSEVGKNKITIFYRHLSWFYSHNSFYADWLLVRYIVKFLQNILFEITVPFRVRQSKVDVFWGAGHRLPLFLPSHIATVVTIHDLVWKIKPKSMRFENRFIEPFLMRYALSKCDLVIAVSASTASDLIEEFPNVKDKVRVIYPGVPKFLNKQNIDCKIKINISDPYILYVGTVEPRKNIERLLRAFSIVKKRGFANHKLVICGGKGWGNVNITRLISDIGLTGAVLYFENVSDDYLSTLYENCLFVALPSLYEGFGFPILEGMHHGKAILTSNVSSMPEVAGNAGVFVNPYSVPSIAKGLYVLMNDTARRKCERFARSQAKNFNRELSALMHFKVFEDARRIRDNV